MMQLLIIKAVKNTEEYEEWMEVVEDRPFNDNRYFINSDKLKSLGWKQKNDDNVLYTFIKESSR